MGRTHIKCPLCMTEIEIKARLEAPKEEKIAAYCEPCDAYVQIICDPRLSSALVQ